MNKFEKQLEKWNNGVLRGAQSKLAKLLGVSTATTALWTSGKRHPSKGYIAQMAGLFGMDHYSVVKLFEPLQTSIIYPDPAPAKSYMLRERGDNDYAYLLGNDTTYLGDDNMAPQSNTVQIPFVQAILSVPPYYNEEDVIEWWSVPRRYAQGAKYLISSQYIGLEDADGPDDLCLVKPGRDIPNKAVLILTNGKNKYIVRKAVHTAQSVDYLPLTGKKAAPVSKQFYPIGQIVKRIKPL